MSDLLRIGSRSLLTYEAALNVVGQNIANVSTPFYSRRQVNFSEAIYNNGVNLSDVSRVFNENASKNLQNSNSNLVSATSYLSAMKNLEMMFQDAIGADPSKSQGNGIGKYLSDAMSSLNQMNSSPQSLQARNLFLYQLNNLSNRFNEMSSQFQIQNNSVNAALAVDVIDINQITTQLSSINLQIKSKNAQDYSALLDQREELLQNLSKFINFNRNSLPDGEINITLDNGSALVFGSQQYNLGIISDPNNPSDSIVVVNVAGSNISVNDSINSGEIGGLLKFRADLEQTTRSFGRLSLAISSALNNQNKLGIDINGKLGGYIFKDINNPALVAGRNIPNCNNNGSMNLAVNIQDCNQLTTSDYRLAFDASNHYVLTRISDNNIVSSGSLSSYPANISCDGFEITISDNSYVVGDYYTIIPTKDASLNMSVIMSDPSHLALGLAVMTTVNPNNNGSGTIQVNSVTDASNSSFSTPYQLNPPLTISFINSSSYQIINANTNTIIEGPISYDSTSGTSIFPTPGGYDPGYRVTISGNTMPGDKFQLQYNTNTAGDNRNGMLLSEIFKQGMLDSGKSTFSQAYNYLSTDVSVKTNSCKLSCQSAEIINTQAKSYYDSISGVSIEEETVNLAQYQQAYQASAQILETARTIFDVILNLSRGA